MPKKSQAGLELFDMSQALGKGFEYDFWHGLGSRGMSNKKAILIIVLAGAFLYYFLVHRRK